MDIYCINSYAIYCLEAFLPLLSREGLARPCFQSQRTSIFEFQFTTADGDYVQLWLSCYRFDGIFRFFRATVEISAKRVISEYLLSILYTLYIIYIINFLTYDFKYHKYQLQLMVLISKAPQVVTLCIKMTMWLIMWLKRLMLQLELTGPLMMTCLKLIRSWLYLRTTSIQMSWYIYLFFAINTLYLKFIDEFHTTCDRGRPTTSKSTLRTTCASDIHSNAIEPKAKTAGNPG